MKKILISLVALVLIIGCQDNTSDTENELKKLVLPTDIKFNSDSITISLIKESEYLQDIFIQKQVVRLEGKDDYWIKHIDDVQVFQSAKRIIIFDDRNDEVFLFNTNGRIICKIGRKGQGPGEHQVIHSVGYFGEKIFISTFPKLLVYDLNGSYLMTYDIVKNTEPFFMKSLFIHDNILYAYQRSQGHNGTVIKYSLKDEKIVNSFGKEIKNYGVGCKLFTPFINKYLLYGGAYKSEIIAIDLNTGTESIFAILEVPKLPKAFTNLKSQDEQVMYRINHIEEMDGKDGYFEMTEVDNFLFVSRVISMEIGYGYSIFDINGSLINNLISSGSYQNLSGDIVFEGEGDAKRKLYRDGLIIYGYEKGRELDSNPTLILCELKESN